MATNPYNNKVQLADGTVLIDLTDTTATAARILQGYGAYGADGAWMAGNIPVRTNRDITVIFGTVSIPAGYYGSSITIEAPADVKYYYTGSSAPSSSVGSDGDLYFKTT